MSEPRLIGAEMLEWSDEPVGGAALAELVTRTVPPGARVLAAGPHAAPLLDALSERGELTCVIRGLPDATALAQRYGDVVTVLCGSLDKLGDVGPFDAIVALDGLDRLVSAGGYVPSWGELADQLTTALAPGGVLLLALPNPLGLHRLTPMRNHPTTTPATPPPPASSTPPDGLTAPGLSTTPDGLTTPGLSATPGGSTMPGLSTVSGVGGGGRFGDGDWPLPEAVRPVTPGQMLAALTERGLAAGACYGAYPHPYRPAVLVDVTAVGRHAASIVRAAEGARPVLEAGLGAQLAPGWVAVAQRGVYGPALPEALVADGPGRWCVVYEEEGGGRRLVDPAGEPMRHGPLSRERAALARPAPGGFTLHEVLVAGCAGADLPLIRELLGSYAAWLRNGASPFATMDNVSAVEHELVDASWGWAEPVAPDVVLARAVRRFVTRLLAEGRRHPWPRDHDADRLCAALHAMAGRPADPAILEAGLRLEAEITALTEERPVAGELVRLRRPDGDLERVRDRAAVLEQQRHWLMTRLDKKEAELAKRTAELATAKEQLKAAKAKARALRGSASYKIGRVVTWPLRRARGMLRAVTR